MFEFEFTNLAKEQLKEIKRNKELTKRYKAALLALGKLQNNPRYPGLTTHAYESLRPW